MGDARVRLPAELEKMPLFQLQDCIKQSNLGEKDTWIINQYIIGHEAQEDIAASLGWTRRTVSKHIKKAFEKMVVISKNLYIHYT